MTDYVAMSGEAKAAPRAEELAGQLEAVSQIVISVEAYNVCHAAAALLRSQSAQLDAIRAYVANIAEHAPSNAFAQTMCEGLRRILEGRKP